MKILAIESSCDETAAAVVEDGRRVLSNIVATQIAEPVSYTHLDVYKRQDLDDAAIKRKTLYLITIMQQMFLRYETLSRTLEIDLGKRETRKAFHTQVLHDILEV